MAYREDWLSGQELLEWGLKHFPEVKIRVRLETNNYAEARVKSDGTLLAFFTSNRALKDYMETKAFKDLLRMKTGSSFGFETAIFEGDGY